MQLMKPITVIESFPSTLQNSKIFIFELNMGIVDNLVSQISGRIVGGISRDLLVVVFIKLRLQSHPGSHFGPPDFVVSSKNCPIIKEYSCAKFH